MGILLPEPKQTQSYSRSELRFETDDYNR